MAELLITVVDVPRKNPPGGWDRGDCIHVLAPHENWGRLDLAHPTYRVVRVPMTYDEARIMLLPETDALNNIVRHRMRKINLDSTKLSRAVRAQFDPAKPREFADLTRTDFDAAMVPDKRLIL